ncbi:MAG: hypothetical protein WCS74_05255 [Dehalococcoidales bacterium]|nr:hypothetical protein [Dehalococcoidales bacterium]MDD4322821.1 hypothetical protein [Dehalococcoidales bacterium]MDD4794665.1 hypothetical protein [Dehalococcoidales bacterium]MDD5498594.1 hypothetical protein [Dehalococcoidales bacterium]
MPPKELPPELVPEPEELPGGVVHLPGAVARGLAPEDEDVGRLLLPVTLRPPELPAISYASLVVFSQLRLSAVIITPTGRDNNMLRS